MCAAVLFALDVDKGVVVTQRHGEDTVDWTIECDVECTASIVAVTRP